MTPSELQQFVEQDEDLDYLFNKNKIYVNTKFSDSKYDNEALKEFIADDYYKSFDAIYSENINGKNKSVLISLLKSIDFLTTPAVKDKIITTHLIPTLEASIETLKELNKNIDTDKLVLFSASVNSALSRPVIQIMNQLGTEDSLKELKVNIIALCLDFCDAVGTVDSSDKPIQAIVYNGVINNLKKVKDFGGFQQRFNNHNRKAAASIESADTSYLVWIIIAIILFAIRLVTRIM